MTACGLVNSLKRNYKIYLPSRYKHIFLSWLQTIGRKPSENPSGTFIQTPIVMLWVKQILDYLTLPKTQIYQKTLARKKYTSP